MKRGYPREGTIPIYKFIKKNMSHMIYVWNGKTSNPLIKSLALNQAFSLEKLIFQGGDNTLRIFFSGGVIRNKKL